MIFITQETTSLAVEVFYDIFAVCAGQPGNQGYEHEMAMKTIIVPGNILLLGEYAVLEEGGLGITLTLNRQLHISISGEQELRIKSRDGSREIQWGETAAAFGDAKFFTHIFEQCRKWCSRQEPGCCYLKALLDIDTSAFYHNERKLAINTDAAMIIGLIRAILADHTIQSGDILELAVDTYRQIHGGNGSGYSLAASLFGGIGLFRGGVKPEFTPVNLSWLPALYLLWNPLPLIISQSVKQYHKWKAAHPARAVDFLIQSNRNVTDLLKASSLEEGIAVLSTAREQGIGLGEEIGVPTVWEEYEDVLELCCAFHKSLGEGNEVGICLPKSGIVPPVLRDLHPEPVVIAGEGLKCSWMV